jgi:hypothetical protein
MCRYGAPAGAHVVTFGVSFGAWRSSGPIGSYAPVSPHALGGMGSGRRVLPGVNIEHSFAVGTEQVYGPGGRSLTQPT